jgi:hypothetical protein
MPAPSNNIGVASGTRQTKRAALRARLEALRPERITEAVFGDLLREFAPVSENYLRRLLRETGIPMAALAEGIRQDSFENLERTLLEMECEYAEAMETGNASRARACRRLVIAAKDHARFSLASPRLAEDQRAAKREMLLWLLTWLENPGIFPAWLALRKNEIYRGSSPAEYSTE